MTTTTTTTSLLTTTPPLSQPKLLFTTTTARSSLTFPTRKPPPPPPRLTTRCEVAVRSDSSVSISDDPSEDPEVKSNLDKVGSKVKVKSPLKVYHVPRVPEFELTTDMVGVIKNYVGFWKGKKITPNYPFKVEFSVEVEGRGMVKFQTHLREDEFEIIE